MRLWESVNNKTEELMSLDMTLMDDKISFLYTCMINFLKFCNLHNLLTLFFIQGDVIHATIWKSLIDTFKIVLKENCMYTIKNFKVQQSTIYRPVENEFHIVFVYNTSVKEVTEAFTRFPQFYFEFATTDTLRERESKDK
jgi:hypothetical protein